MTTCTLRRHRITPRLLTPRQVCEVLAIDPGELARLVAMGEMTPVDRHGTPHYSAAAIESYIDSQK
jgi:hypothetical protein